MNTPLAEPSRRGSPSSDDVLLYCVRTVVSEHNEGPRRRYHARQQSTMVTDRPRSAKDSKSNPLSSVMEIVNSTHSSSKDKKKFPKELIKAFEDSLKRVIMRQESAYDDVLVRGTFGAFYAYYVSDTFQKSMKDNRKIEDIILMFVSKAIAELQKRVSDSESKEIVTVHVAKFVRLLLQTVRTQKLASNDSELVQRLAEYEKKLLQNAQYLSPTPRQVEAIQQEQQPLEVRVKDSPMLQKLALVYDLSIESMQSLVDVIVPEATDEALLRDLKLLLEQVQGQNGAAYRMRDFREENSYTSWRQKEVTDLTSRILKLTTANPQLTKAAANGSSHDKASRSRTSSFSSDKPSLSNRFSTMSVQDTSSSQGVAKAFYYIPADPFESYQSLLQSLLVKDKAYALQESTEEHPMLFSKVSTELLGQCKDRWRITAVQHKLALVHACCAAFIDGRLTLDELDQAFFDVESNEVHQDQYLTIQLQALYTNDLVRLNDALFRDLYEELQQIYESKINSQVLIFMDEYIFSDPCFSEAATATAHMFDELEIALRQVAELRYRAHRDAICAPADLEILRIVKLAETLQKDISTYRKRYPKPLLDIIHVTSIYLKVVYTQFLFDLKPLLEQCYRNAKAQGLDFAIEDMFELYRSVSTILDTLKAQQADFESPVNVDLYFRPYILKWLQQANAAVMSLVPKVLEADNFRPQSSDVEMSDCNSESISLLFKSFTQHLTFLRNLQWPDEYWSAKFVTILSHTFSNAVKEYSLLIQQLFVRECAIAPVETDPNESHASTIQRKLLSKARDTLAKREPIEPLNISSTACVKLNNIVSAKEYLNVLEGSVNSAAITSILEKYEGERNVWTSGQAVLFSVKVISAQDIPSNDSNGFSDAYVVLNDQRGKRIGKTRAIYTNSSPHWDESFDIGTQESMWLAATIWDRSATGEHDVRGRCYFKLDPTSFTDMVPKEVRIGLDTHGFLFLRITMEIEVDESVFYFARAFRYLNRAEGDMSRLIVERMTPFINTALSRHNLRTLHPKNPTIDATIGSAYNLLSKAGFSGARTSAYIKDKTGILTNQDIEAPIEPLMQYLDDNFRTLDGSLNRSAFLTVMSRLWDHVLSTIEDMIVPQLSARNQKTKKALSEEELDTCYKWLGFLKDTFAGDGGGLSPEELQTPHYHELLSVRFFYFDDIDDLMHECERMAASTSAKVKQMELTPLVLRRAYNLGTIKHNRDEKRAYQRALATSEDIILRVLRLRGDTRAQEFVNRRVNAKTRESAREPSSSNVSRHATIHSRSSKAESRGHSSHGT